MNGKSIIFVLILGLIWACEEEDIVPDGKTLPNGLVAFTEEELAFLPNPTEDRIYGELPDLIQEITLLYDQEKSDNYVYAWHQYFYKFSTNFNLKAEFRFRYLETNENTFKTLYIGLNYLDQHGKLRKQEFELPVNIKDTANTYFSTYMNFHPEISFGEVVWEDVYELFPIQPTPEIENGYYNYKKIYYSRHYGIIMIRYISDEVWLLKL